MAAPARLATRVDMTCVMCANMQCAACVGAREHTRLAVLMRAPRMLCAPQAPPFSRLPANLAIAFHNIRDQSQALGGATRAGISCVSCHVAPLLLTLWPARPPILFGLYVRLAVRVLGTCYHTPVLFAYTYLPIHTCCEAWARPGGRARRTPRLPPAACAIASALRCCRCWHCRGLAGGAHCAQAAAAGEAPPRPALGIYLPINIAFVVCVCACPGGRQLPS